MPDVPEQCAVEAALQRAYLPLLRALAGVMAPYYGLLAIVHLSLLDGGAAAFMAIVAAASCLLIGAIRLVVLRSTRTLLTLERSAVFVVTVVCLNIATHAKVVGDPIQFVYLPVVLTAAALIGPTKRAVMANVAITAASGALILAGSPADLIVPFLFTGLTTVVICFAAGRWKIDVVERQAQLQTRSEALATELREMLDSAIARAEVEREANEARGQYVATISHELRTPLNGIIGVAGALKALELPDRQREMVDLIEKSGVTLQTLVSDILDLAKIEAGKLELDPEPFSFPGEINPLLDLMETSATAKGLRFERRIDPSAAGCLVGDATRIKQIISNLLNNAIKFTGNGVVSFGAAYDTTAGCVELSFRDTGIGFGPDVAARLFGRYNQADKATARTHGGTGLGLAICRTLTEAMGGTITATSQPGEGSLFRVVLPLAEAAGMPARVASSQQHGDIERLGDQHLQVLLAEDHPANQTVVRMILEPLGVDLTIAENGAEALALLNHRQFDIVLMDMQMPVMDGLEATRGLRALELREHRRYTPVIMLTGNAMTYHKTASLEAGADMHVSKPVTPQALFSAIATLLDSGDADGAAQAHQA